MVMLAPAGASFTGRLAAEGRVKTSTEIRRIPSRETWELRHRILRPNQPLEQCIYPGDDTPPTAHFGAFREGTLVGIASVYPEPQPGAPAAAADWRLRGMATSPDVRGSGLGAELVRACIAYVSGQRGRGIWCNARTPACGFYEKLGFTRRGREFELPGIGPHFVMDRAVLSAGDRSGTLP
jgi:predicted GNAT family N-acyltransferase